MQIYNTVFFQNPGLGKTYHLRNLTDKSFPQSTVLLNFTTKRPPQKTVLRLSVFSAFPCLSATCSLGQVLPTEHHGKGPTSPTACSLISPPRGFPIIQFGIHTLLVWDLHLLEPLPSYKILCMTLLCCSGMVSTAYWSPQKILVQSSWVRAVRAPSPTSTQSRKRGNFKSLLPMGKP